MYFVTYNQEVVAGDTSGKAEQLHMPGEGPLRHLCQVIKVSGAGRCGRALLESFITSQSLLDVRQGAT
jgi:hypothetical protein